MDEAERRAIEFKDDLRWVMSTKSGRRILNHFIVHCGMFRSSFSGENEKSTEFLEGQRSVALMVWKDLERHTPEQLDLLLKENRNVYRPDEDEEPDPEF